MEQSHLIKTQRLKQQEREKHEEAGQDQIEDKTQAQTIGQTQLGTQRQTAMQQHRDTHGQGGKQVQQQKRPVTGPEIVGQGSKKEEQEQQQEQSEIHDDWSKICKAISSLSDATLDDCVKRLNDSLFKKLCKSSEIKADISIETFDIIMNEIDDDVKIQHLDKKIRKFIKKPVMLKFVFALTCAFVLLYVYRCVCVVICVNCTVC